MTVMPPGLAGMRRDPARLLCSGDRGPMAVPNSASVRDVPNLADLVRRAAGRGGDRPALRWGDRVVTWAELDAQVDAAAGGLATVAGEEAAPGRADVDGGPAAASAAPAVRVGIALPN